MFEPYSHIMFFKLKYVLLCVALLVSLQLLLDAKKCKLCRRRAREKRLLAVRGQILSKLGFSNPPKTESFNFDNATEENVMNMFTFVVKQRHGEALEALRLQQNDDSNYFAKEIVQLPLVDQSGADAFLSK